MLTSFSNRRLKEVRELLEQPSKRRKAGAFVAEGWKMYREIPEELLLETYVSETFSLSHPEIAAEVVADDVFARLSGTVTPQGIMALVRKTQPREEDLYELCRDSNGSDDHSTLLLLVLEGIQDPGNLGTMIRTGEGAGLSALIMDENCADPYSPKVVRSTMGSLLRVPIFRVRELKEVISRLASMDIEIYGTAVEGSGDFRNIDYYRRAAILIGNESRGLSPSLLNLCSCRAHIPMRGKVESLNAAISAALLMYECAGKQAASVKGKSSP